MHSNIFLRVCSSIIMAPLIWFVVWYGKSIYEDYSIPLFKIFLALLGAGLSWEWDMMFNKKQTSSGNWLILGAVFLAFLSEDNPVFSLWLMLPLMIFVYLKSNLNFLFTCGVLYICLPIFSFSYLYFTNGDSSREMLLWLFFVVWATDVGGYIVGKTVGGPKLCPKISPKKTWSGALGGTVFSMLVAWIFAMYLKAYGFVDGGFHFTARMLVVSAGVLSVISQIGDLVESYIKRKLSIKDSSNLIPGHGGVFDRVDGLIFVVVVVAFIVYLTTVGGEPVS